MSIVNTVKKFIDFFKDENVPIETKNLYLVLTYSILGTVMFIFSFASNHLKMAGIYFLIAMLVFFVLLMYLAFRFEKILLFKYILTFGINIFLLPIAHFLTRDIFNGTAFFFPLGLIFTFFLLKGKSVYIVFAIELLWYGYIILLPMYDYGGFEAYREACPPAGGIPFSFVAVSLGLLFVIMYQSIIVNSTIKSLNESRKIIEEAKNNKGRFLANITHAIRLPMNSIVGMNELILREELNSESRELAENIKSSSNHLLNIINNILEYSKLDMSKIELLPNKYDFAELMTEIIDSVSNECASENTEFTASIDPNIPKLLFGDNIRIKQIFLYLLFASLGKSPQTRISLDVKGDVDISTNSVLLNCTISESGFGLSESEIDAMLSFYSRYDSRQKSDFNGMGLELSICREIIKLMGGTLKIQSIEGVGMSYCFEFINYIIEDIPLAKVSLVKDYNILVYTKNTTDRKIFADILESFNLYPNFVTGPNAFRQAIENKRYTHIFMDDMFYPILSDTIKASEIIDELYIITEPGSIYSDFGKCKILRKPMTSICVANALNNTWDESAFKVSQKREAVKYPEGKILIVDDSLVNLRILEGMLDSFEINTTMCKSGPEALEILYDNDFDMIILDQRMPEMDGIELLHLIRKLNNSNSMVPILCATADFGSEVSKMLLNEGFQDYLAKPIRKFYLERMLRNYMPKELAVNFVVEVEETFADGFYKATSSDNNNDPLIIDFEGAKNNVGGDNNAFSAVLNSYYKEGRDKIYEVPQMLAEKDIQNYVINVHALKSSSFAVGAYGLSVLFKELEFAGRAENIEFLEVRSNNVFEKFSIILDKVYAYLLDKDLLESEDTKMPEGDVVEFEISRAQEILDALTNFNIKTAEDSINKLSQCNFGYDINVKIKDIKNCIDMFDYIKAKELLNSLL